MIKLNNKKKVIMFMKWKTRFQIIFAIICADTFLILNCVGYCAQKVLDWLIQLIFGDIVKFVDTI